MKSLIVRFVREDAGQDLIEYTLIAGLISVAAVAAITAAGGSINTIWGRVQTATAAAAAGAPAAP